MKKLFAFLSLVLVLSLSASGETLPIQEIQVQSLIRIMKKGKEISEIRKELGNIKKPTGSIVPIAVQNHLKMNIGEH